MARTGELDQQPASAPAATTDTPAAAPPDTGWRFDRKDLYLRYGIPNDPAGGWFDASKERKGMGWATSGNGFTGNINDKGLNMFAGGDLNLAAQADWKKQAGDLSLNLDERKLLNLHGEGSGLDKYKLSLTSPLSLGGDRLLTPELRHQVEGGKATDTAGLSYKSGDVTQGVDFNLGQPGVTNRLSLSNPTDTINFSQQFGQHEGASLDFKHKYGDSSVLSGGASHLDDVDKLKLGYESPLAGGRWNGSVGFTHDPAKLDSYDLGLGWKNDKGGFNISGHEGGDDNRNLKLDWNRVLGDKRSVSGSFGAADTAEGTKLNTDFKLQPMPELKLGAGLSHTLLDGGGTATGGSLSADWRSAGLGASLAAEGAMGSAPGADSMKLRADMLGRVAPNWYVGGQGNLGLQEGKDPSYFVGGNVTYQPKDWLALSAGLGYGSNGPAARLQADIFKDQPKGAGDLMDARRKGGTVSLFAEGSMGGAASPFGGSFGEGKHTVPFGGSGGPQLTLGLGYNF